MPAPRDRRAILTSLLGLGASAVAPPLALAKLSQYRPASPTPDISLPPFIDAHIHLWDLSYIRYDWLTPPFSDHGPNGNVEPIAHDYGTENYRRDLERWNVLGAVHVDAGAAPGQSLVETEWLDGLAQKTGIPSGFVAFAPLNDPGVDTLLERQARYQRVKGIRQIVNWHKDPNRTYSRQDVTLDPQWEKGYALLARHGLSFDLQCYPAQMEHLAQIVERHPDIPVIINHMGMPILRDPQGFTIWHQGLKKLASQPHVAIKLSGMGFIRRDWTRENVEPFVCAAIDLFGTERCMFASDTPTDKLFASIDRTMETYHTIVADFSEEERCALFAGNANRIYRLGIDL